MGRSGRPRGGLLTALSLAVSSDIAKTPSEIAVRLPNSNFPVKHPVTGLFHPSVVVCNWSYDLPVGDIQEIFGVVPEREWFRLVAILHDLTDAQ